MDELVEWVDALAYGLIQSNRIFNTIGLDQIRKIKLKSLIKKLILRKILYTFEKICH